MVILLFLPTNWQCIAKFAMTLPPVHEIYKKLNNIFIDMHFIHGTIDTWISSNMKTCCKHFILICNSRQKKNSIFLCWHNEVCLSQGLHCIIHWPASSVVESMLKFKTCWVDSTCLKDGNATGMNNP